MGELSGRAIEQGPPANAANEFLQNNFDKLNSDGKKGVSKEDLVKYQRQHPELSAEDKAALAYLIKNYDTIANAHDDWDWFSGESAYGISKQDADVHA